jgi:hypothetical protein
MWKIKKKEKNQKFFRVDNRTRKEFIEKLSIILIKNT